VSVPAFERLRRDLGQRYWLIAASGERFPAELHAAVPGVPINARHSCYAARFALPPGVRLPQAIYTVQAGDDEWNLLLVPVGPCEGRALLEAVLHCPIPQASAGQSHA
jgi:hypothetical protein